MRAAESLLAWTPGTPQQVHVGPWPARPGDESSRYTHWTPAIGRWSRGGPSPQTDEIQDFLFRTFRHLVVREGMDPLALDRELLKLDEWARMADEDQEDRL